VAENYKRVFELGGPKLSVICLFKEVFSLCQYWERVGVRVPNSKTQYPDYQRKGEK
jgi:hypothetical protein